MDNAADEHGYIKRTIANQRSRALRYLLPPQPSASALPTSPRIARQRKLKVPFEASLGSGGKSYVGGGYGSTLALQHQHSHGQRKPLLRTAQSGVDDSEGEGDQDPAVLGTTGCARPASRPRRARSCSSTCWGLGGADWLELGSRPALLQQASRAAA